jgi:microcompartment protein CcmL/EutN
MGTAAAETVEGTVAAMEAAMEAAAEAVMEAVMEAVAAVAVAVETNNRSPVFRPKSQGFTPWPLPSAYS